MSTRLEWRCARRRSACVSRLCTSTAGGRTLPQFGGHRADHPSEVFSAYVLQPLLGALRQAHPEIQIELVASNAVENLLERQADVALRMVRPRQPELVARRLADQPMGVYAHRDYLRRHGVPTAEDWLRHQWVGFDRSDQMLRGFRDAGLRSRRRCSDSVATTRSWPGRRCRPPWAWA